MKKLKVVALGFSMVAAMALAGCSKKTVVSSTDTKATADEV